MHIFPQFADRARSVLVRVKANEVVDDKVLLARAQVRTGRRGGRGEGREAGGREEGMMMWSAAFDGASQ